MDYKPLGQRVLVKKQEDEKENLKSSIIITDIGDESNNEVVYTRRATVIALGHGILRQDGSKLPFSVKIGDEVIMPYSYAEDLGVNGEKNFTIIEESAINCICVESLKVGRKVSLKNRKNVNGRTISDGAVSCVLDGGLYIVDFGGGFETTVSFDSLNY